MRSLPSRRVAVLAATLAAFATLFPTVAFARHLKEGDVRFKTTCNYLRTAADDPIVFPDQPGASHRHDFFGNKGADASTTTYQMLADEGRTTCNNAGDLAAYWVPEVTSDGVKVTPMRMTAYYRLGRKHPRIEAYPPGLKMIAGWSHDLGSSSSSGWQCGESPGNKPLPAVPEGCADVNLVVRYPDCWNGRDLDSADHRSHMAYSMPAGDANQCPPTHPVPVPAMTTYVNYGSIPPGSSLSSGDQSTVHGDFFNGWDPDVLRRMIDECLHAGVFCESGGTEIGTRD